MDYTTARLENRVPAGDTNRKLYICPGETHPISRSVHLARLTNCYPACRSCALRNETGLISDRTVRRLAALEGFAAGSPIVTERGIRGVYVNQMTAGGAGRIAAAFAGELSRAMPLIGRTHARRPASPLGRPAIVVGHDQRPSSAAVQYQVTIALKQAGCDVVETGRTTGPCLQFTVRNLRATGGIHVTGSGCPPAWTGLDIYGSDGLRIPSSGTEPVAADKPDRSPSLRTGGTEGCPHLRITLEQLAAHRDQPAPRATRSAGTHRIKNSLPTYRDALRAEFHALRPLVVCVGSADEVVLQLITGLFDELPCNLVTVPLPQRVRAFHNADPDVGQLAAAVQESGAHIGTIVDDDARRVCVLDELGDVVEAAGLRRLLDDRPSDVQRQEQPEMVPDMPPGDAIVMIARLLSELSLSDACLSRRIRDALRSAA